MGGFGGYQGWYGGNNVAGAGTGGWNSSYCGGGSGGFDYSSTFVLIVVLFILLVIVGATFV